MSEVTTLQIARESSQGLLLYGEDSGALRRLAVEIAQFHLCQKPAEAPCGECSACLSSVAQQNSDLLTVAPQGRGQLIPVDAIKGGDSQGVKPFARTRPLSSRLKVIHIENAHRLSHEAATALLLILEEPPSYVRFILTSNQMSRILPTILSRCLCLPCKEETRMFQDLPAHMHVFADRQSDRAEFILEHMDQYQALFELFESFPKEHPKSGLRQSEFMREMGDNWALPGGANQPGRNGHAEVLRCLACWSKEKFSHQPQILTHVLEVHQLIEKNANPRLQLDRLMCSIQPFMNKPST